MLGPVLTADLRMLVAGVALAVWFRFSGFDVQWRRWGLQYALVGMLTSGVPFILYAYAALQMTAGQMAVLNATSPMWGALMSAIRWAPNVPSKGLAVGTQVASGLIVLPLVTLWPPMAAPTPLVVGSVLTLGLVCGAIAYILYFRLIADLGPTGALTVTYLTPVFGMLWGTLFLAEARSR